MNRRKIVVTAQNKPINVARRSPVVVVNYAEHAVRGIDHSVLRDRLLDDISSYIDKLIAGEIDDIVIKRSEGWGEPTS